MKFVRRRWRYIVAGKIYFGFRQLSWLTVGLAVMVLDAADVHAAVPSQPNTTLGVSAIAAKQVELAATLKPDAESGPDQAGKASAAPKVDDSKGEAKLQQCKLQWTAADADGDGLLAGAEITAYNNTIRTQNQLKLSEDARLTQTDFMKACLAVAAHE
jgi:hypothetical protein